MKPAVRGQTAVSTNADGKHAKVLDGQFAKAERGMVEIVILGAALCATRDELTRRAIEGGDSVSLKAWLSAHLPERSYAAAVRSMGLAENAAKMAKLAGSTDIGWLLTAGIGELSRDLEAKRAKLEKLLAESSGNQLLLWGKEKTAGNGKTGGDVALQAWLKKHHPAHAGAKLADLPKSVRLLWEAHMDELAAAKNPEGESRRRLTAREFYDELRDSIHRDLSGTKHYTRLPAKDLALTISLLKDAAARLSEEVTR